MSAGTPQQVIVERKPVPNASAYERVPHTHDVRFERPSTKDQGRPFANAKKSWPLTTTIFLCDVVLTLLTIAFIGNTTRRCIQASY
jgi:hypothetical protein